MKTEPHERVVSGVFNSRDEAHRALDALAPTGIETENISVIANMRDFEEEEFSEIAGIKMHDESIHAAKIGRRVGAVVAGITALAGMIIGKVAVLPAALIVLAVSGFGALLGTVIAAGFTDNEWEKLTQAIREGKVLLAIHTYDHSSTRKVAEILKNCRAQAVHTH